MCEVNGVELQYHTKPDVVLFLDVFPVLDNPFIQSLQMYVTVCPNEGVLINSQHPAAMTMIRVTCYSSCLNPHLVLHIAGILLFGAVAELRLRVITGLDT